MNHPFDVEYEPRRERVDQRAAEGVFGAGIAMLAVLIAGVALGRFLFGG